MAIRPAVRPEAAWPPSWPAWCRSHTGPTSPDRSASPRAFCGGVGLKPSRGRVSFGPMLDENGYGLAQNFVQTKTVRDAAAMLDCLAVPQPGDPFIIPRPVQSYAQLAHAPAPRLRIGYSSHPLMG